MKKNRIPENIAFEIDFYERLIADKPDFIDALIPLANAYTEAGRYHKGLTIDKRLARLRPHDEIVFYNLACSFALVKMPDEAFAALHKAVQLGYSDYEHLLRDKDLDYIRKDERFSRIVTVIKQRRNISL